ncbi:hypothetical protein DPMN_122754 [Dreissena polymorpha]|uniref:Uncharacterized protein n=1 Tax=Dreissena polymorpha TaxID=45954 RepID=A0A9D4JQV4_DREPO|nr:hypothetical protein DPMN_122754 [Dreissena polymorpha]
MLQTNPRRRVLVKKVKISKTNELLNGTSGMDITAKTLNETSTADHIVTDHSLNSTQITETEQVITGIRNANGITTTSSLLDVQQAPQITTVVPEASTNSEAKKRRTVLTTVSPFKNVDHAEIITTTREEVVTTIRSQIDNSNLNVNDVPTGTNQDIGVHTSSESATNATADTTVHPADTAVDNNPGVSVVIQVTSENQGILDKSNQTEIMGQPPDTVHGTETNIDLVNEMGPLDGSTNITDPLLRGSLRRLNPPVNFPSRADLMLKDLNRLVDKIRRMCDPDIQGRDRPCCNQAVRCFEDFPKLVGDDLDNSVQGSFAFASACRKLGSELKRDKLCVQNALSSCGGLNRNLIQRRFDTRVNNIYSQYNRYCLPTTTAVTTSEPATTPTSAPVVPTTKTLPPEAPSPIDPPTGGPPFSAPADGSGGREIAHTHDIDSPGASSAIIAGVVTGGVILALVLIIAVVLWCRHKRNRHASGSSSDSAGVFFQKRPNTSANQHRNNNNKPNLDRQLSDLYAEIDEAMVNPGYKPPVPGSLSLPGYIHPVSDDDSGSSYTPAPTSGRAAITTRGQLSYGPILAANARKISDVVTPYHTTTITTDADLNRMKRNEMRSSDISLPPRFLSRDLNRGSAERITDLDEESVQDDYELPISANASLKYASLDNEPEPPPSTPAPAVPSAESTPNTQAKHKKMAVKVLPSNPLPHVSATSNSTSGATSSTPASGPVPTPRKRADMNSDSSKSETDEQAQTTINHNSRISQSLSTNDRVTQMKDSEKASVSRDSCVSESSAKSSHHYYVLEKDENDRKDDFDYANSISPGQLV